ncbi:MAG TPA: inositol monophosphatase [Candidatus Saccharimonadales bacterium]|nr:inositol monophosphatase [Candidatus Saccharimonadales bacterium]
MSDTETLLSFAIEMAEEAGKIMRHYFTLSDKGVEIKADHSPVSIADKKINRLLIERVQQVFPAHGVQGEEESYNQSNNELWVCDPIDGTVGFIWGVPTAMFSLAYVVNGQPHVAVIYEPQLNKMYTAIKGNGTFLNGERLCVSQHTSLYKANVGMTSSVGRLLEREAFCKALLAAGTRLSTLPGNVLNGSLVARGRLDGYIFPGRGAHDIAAEKLIIEEAGGKVTSLDGVEQRYDDEIRGAVISNGHIHQALVEHLQQFGVENYLGYSK